MACKYVERYISFHILDSIQLLQGNNFRYQLTSITGNVFLLSALLAELKDNDFHISSLCSQ